MGKRLNFRNREYLRSAMFGANDALVSTTGVIVGVSTGTSNKSVIILTGVVTILVEALSMGAGEYQSLKSAQQLDKKHSKNTESHVSPITSGIIMFTAYFLGGLVPLLPIVLLPVGISRNVTIIASLVGLFALGYYKGKVVGQSPIKSAMEVFIIGGIGTAIGIIVGNILKV